MAQLLGNFPYKEMGFHVLSCYDAEDKSLVLPAANLNLPSPDNVDGDITESDKFKSSSETTSQVLQELDDLLGL